MITVDIAVEVTLAQHEKIKAVITPNAFRDIVREFQESSEWKHFEEYCYFLTRPDNSTLTPAPFVQKFEKSLSSIIKKHTKYYVLFFWPLVDAMSEEVIGRKPW